MTIILNTIIIIDNIIYVHINYYLYYSNNHNKKNLKKVGTYISPEKRLSAVCKTSSLLRFPISVGRDPYVNYMHLSLLKYKSIMINLSNHILIHLIGIYYDFLLFLCYFHDLL